MNPPSNLTISFYVFSCASPGSCVSSHLTIDHVKNLILCITKFQHLFEYYHRLKTILLFEVRGRKPKNKNMRPWGFPNFCLQNQDNQGATYAWGGKNHFLRPLLANGPIRLLFSGRTPITGENSCVEHPPSVLRPPACSACSSPPVCGSKEPCQRGPGHRKKRNSRERLGIASRYSCGKCGATIR